MTISRSHKEELIANLRDKEYRDAFVSSHIDNGIPFQIRALREQRNLTQEEFANITHKKQEAICRLENPNYGSFTLATLKEIASAFDVALVVKFVPFSELVEWDVKLSPNSLRAASFEKDPYFQEKEDEATITADSKQYAVTSEQGTSDNVVFLKDYSSRRSASLSQKIPIVTASVG